MIIHFLIHIGPSLAAALLVWWIAARYGQTSRPADSARLPLAGLPDEPVPLPSHQRRRPWVLITLAVIVGISLGIPVATTYVALRSDGVQAILQGHGGDH